jgi:D-alanyl-D-alanine carboxypeptidase/D-alanyl-D-alanine-endopeptidase (penicillin-binding protein 4)
MPAFLDPLLLRLPYRRPPRLAALFVLSAIACWGEPGAHGAASPALPPASADFPDEEPVLAPAQPPVPAPLETQAPAPALVPVARPTPAPSDLPTQLAPELAALSSWVKTRKGDLGFALRDLGTGRELMGDGANHALNPASNQKLVTAAVALSLLGPSYRFHVGVLGKINGGVATRLVLRGNGDPSFSYDDLRELTAKLVALGLKRVTGDILVDQGAFDDQYTPPAFEQQPSEWAPFRAPVSGVSLNRNAVTLHVFPTQPGQVARAEFEPPGYVSVQGEVRTEKGKKRDHVGLTMRPQGTALSARVSGDIPAGDTVVHLSKRIENPEIFAAAVLKRELVSVGVAVQGQAARGGEDETDELVGRDSATLAELTAQLGKASDNFYAETLFKALGARAKGAPGSAEKASAAITEWLTARGLSEDGLQIRNGSGLYDANRISARMLTRLLEAAYLDPAISSAYQEQLAVGGLDGTLRTRFYALRNRRSVHAKTGTLNKVVALSGYVFGPEQQTGVSFSILVSGISGEHGEARKRIDALVLGISDRLWKREAVTLASR